MKENYIIISEERFHSLWNAAINKENILSFLKEMDFGKCIWDTNSKMKYQTETADVVCKYTGQWINNIRKNNVGKTYYNQDVYDIAANVIADISKSVANKDERVSEFCGIVKFLAANQFKNEGGLDE